MLNLNETIQAELQRTFPEQFVEWELYLPSVELQGNFANVLENLGNAITTFQATIPDSPRGAQEVVQNGTSVENTSTYFFCILKVPQRITRKHVMKMKEGTQYFAVLTDLADEMTNRTISRIGIKLISDVSVLP